MNEVFVDPNLLRIVVPLALLDLILKGFAMWRAAKNNQRNWFVVLLFLNTIGILPILYLTIFAKKK